ncbi:hypothetical protein H6G89_11250 [Oscillatoria sp. FACHB-1407]|nr:hypothetical protein [Oscillatoria sp. FACHB-1407]MBD2461627.1 hypothetical protein [Oscillatoria sp. FACHB-1407]
MLPQSGLCSAILGIGIHVGIGENHSPSRDEACPRCRPRYIQVYIL